MFDNINKRALISGVWNLNNPQTGAAWTDEQEYLDYVAAKDAEKAELQPQETPAPTMTLKVIDVEDGDSSVLQPGNLVAVEAGETVTVTVEIQDKDANVLPIDADFILPISGVSGALSRAKKATFTQGQATVSITWPNSGIWEVTEQDVNADIANVAEQFLFEGLRFKIYEA